MRCVARPLPSAPLCSAQLAGQLPGLPTGNDCTHLPPPRRRLSLCLPPRRVPAGVLPLVGGVSTACGAVPHAGGQLYRILLFPRLA